MYSVNTTERNDNQKQKYKNKMVFFSVKNEKLSKCAENVHKTQRTYASAHTKKEYLRCTKCPKSKKST